MRRLLIPALLFIATAPASAETLSTTFAGGNSNNGIMYDVRADKPLSITAIQFASASSSSGTVEIYTKGGTHVGSEGTATDWTLIVSSPYAAGPIEVAKAPVVFPSPLLIQPGETRAFYIRQTANALSYTNGSGVGTVEANDGTLSILQGTGVGGLFGLSAVDRIPNVTMHYSRTPGVLTTTFVGSNGNKGIMFDLVATNALTIEALQFPLSGGAGPFTVNLYTKGGTHVGFETDATAWSLVATVSVPVWAGDHNPVILNLPPISIPQGASRAFFIFSPDASIRYSNGGAEAVGHPEASDGNLTILKGRALANPFSGPGAARVPNVAIYYRDPDRFAPTLTIIGKKRIRATGPRVKIVGVASDDVALAGVKARYRRIKRGALGPNVTKNLSVQSSGLFSLNLKLAPGRNTATFTATDASGRASTPVRVKVTR